MQNAKLVWNTTWRMHERYDKLINDMWNDMKNIWYVRNAGRVILNDNKNEKMLGPHILLCACIRRYPLLFTIIRTCTLRDKKTIIMFIIRLQWPSRKMIIHYAYHNAAMTKQKNDHSLCLSYCDDQAGRRSFIMLIIML